MDEYSKNCLKDEPELKIRVVKLQKLFTKLYSEKPDLIVRSPGRAEVIGNHTDYNQGYALSNCISKSFLALFRKRADNLVKIYSTNYSTPGVVVFSLSKIEKDNKNPWSNYARGVFVEFEKLGNKINGIDILIDSTIPVGAGVSSSAAYELAIAKGITDLYKIKISQLDFALLGQRAENQFVGSPCGFLDQGTITFGKSGKLVFMDFKPKAKLPVSKVTEITANLDKFGASFVVAVDNHAKHDLGASGYPIRRKMCEDSLEFWSAKLMRKMGSLRDLGVEDFEKHKKELENFNPVMRKRVEHVVYENERVLSAVEALKENNITLFGRLLSESGESALRLYELDEKTPELTFLYNFGKSLSEVLGIRNMGGGFSATALALVKDRHYDNFKKKLGNAYKKKFKHELEFIKFKITSGVGILNI